MATKMVNGEPVELTAQEEAEFRASQYQRTVAHAKADAKRTIMARFRAETDEESLLEVANPGARVTAARTNARALWLSVKACTTVAEVDAVNLEAGW